MVKNIYDGRKPAADQKGTLKTCRSCRKLVPLEDFITPRHRRCLPCTLRDHRLALVYAHNTAIAELKGKPGLTSTREGRRDYQRLRYRNLMGERGPPMHLPKAKLCRRCQRMLPIDAFGSWRIRICLECDGPIATDLVRAGIK